MPDSPKLDINAIKYLNYHWFWGLRYNEIPQLVNLNSEAVKLLQDEDALTRIKQSQLILDSHHAIVRFFYWLFNKNNYTYHAYLLVACNLHQPCSDKTLEDVVESGYFVLTLLVSGLAAAAVARLYYLLGHEEVASSAPVNTIAVDSEQNVSLRVEDNSIEITPSMLPHLKVLDIHLNTGELLTLTSVKSAYKSLSLRVHPDKGGTKEEFCRLHEATDFLITMMSSPESNPQADLSALWEEILAEATAIRAEIARINAGYVEIKKEQATFVVMLKQREECAQIEKIELNARFEKFDAKCDARFEKFEAELKAELDAKFERRHAEFTAELNAKFESRDAEFRAERNAEFEEFKANCEQIIQATGMEKESHAAHSPAFFKGTPVTAHDQKTHRPENST